MRTQENVQIVKDFFAALGSGDKRGLLALVAKDIEWIIPGELLPHCEQVEAPLGRPLQLLQQFWSHEGR